MTAMKQYLHDKSNRSEVDKYFEDQAKLMLEKRKLEVIDNFSDYFDFLNNEFPCEVYYQGLVYRSVSHAYQAARSTEQHIREKIVRADSLEELYDLAGKVEDPPNWQNDRIRIMERLIRDKFRRNRDLQEQLKATGTRELINTYWEYSTSNVFWGVFEGKGQNQLGRLLSSVRSDIIANLEIDKWLFSSFELQTDKFFMPLVMLDIAKGDQAVQKIPLAGKSYYLMGKLKTADVIMEHPSLSRNHACIIIDSEQGVCLVDLGSKSGSFVDGKKTDNCIPARLKHGQKLTFGSSSRTYTIEIDYSQVEKNIEFRRAKIEKELNIAESMKNDSTSQQLKSSQPDIQEDTLFVGNLPPTATKEEIEELFSKYGKVKDIRIPMDRRTGTQKSICFITYQDDKDCKKALKSFGIGLKIGENKLKVSAAKRQEGRDDDRVDRGKFARDSKRYEEQGKEDVDRRHSRRDDRRRDRDDDRKRDSKRSRRDSRDRERGSKRRDRSPRDRDRSSRDRDRKKKDDAMEVENSGKEEEKNADSKDKKQESRKRSNDRSVEKKRDRKAENGDKKDPTQEKQEADVKKGSRSGSSSSSEAEKKNKKRRKHSASSSSSGRRDNAKNKKKTNKRSRSRSASRERHRSRKPQEDEKKKAKKEEKEEEKRKKAKRKDSEDSSSDSSSDSDSSDSD